MEVKANGITGLIRDIFRSKEREIQQKYYQKHEELLNKIKKTSEYQELQKKIDDLEKQQEKVSKERDKLTEHLGRAWEFDKLAQERLNSEFIKVRIAVMGSEIEEARKAIEEFAKKEFWEG